MVGEKQEYAASLYARRSHLLRWSNINRAPACKSRHRRLRFSTSTEGHGVRG